MSFVASVLSECMQYSDSEDLSVLDRILLSLRSSTSRVGDILDEILVTGQRQMQDGIVANLRQLSLCLSELCVHYETKLLLECLVILLRVLLSLIQLRVLLSLIQ